VADIVQVEGRIFSLAEPVDKGGQATIHALPGEPNYLLKKFLREPDATLARKLRFMARLGDKGEPARLAGRVAWPLAVATRPGSGQAVVGYAMRAVPAAWPLARALKAKNRQAETPALTFRDMAQAAEQTARLVADAHESGLTLCDISPKNFLLSLGLGGAKTWAVDADSWQIDMGGEFFASDVGGTRGYMAPERLNAPASRPREASADNYSLAALLFRVLMDDMPHCDGEPAGGEAWDEDERIKRGLFVFGRDGGLRPPPASFGTLPFESLPPALRDLFRRALETDQGAFQPHLRPTAREWASALGTEGARMRLCRREPLHWHFDSPELAGCPWCALGNSAGSAGGAVPRPAPPVQPVHPFGAPAAAPAPPRAGGAAAGQGVARGGGWAAPAAHGRLGAGLLAQGAQAALTRSPAALWATVGAGCLILYMGWILSLALASGPPAGAGGSSQGLPATAAAPQRQQGPGQARSARERWGKLETSFDPAKTKREDLRWAMAVGLDLGREIDVAAIQRHGADYDYAMRTGEGWTVVEGMGERAQLEVALLASGRCFVLLPETALSLETMRQARSAFADACALILALTQRDWAAETTERAWDSEEFRLYSNNNSARYDRIILPPGVPQIQLRLPSLGIEEAMLTTVSGKSHGIPIYINNERVDVGNGMHLVKIDDLLTTGTNRIHSDEEFSDFTIEIARKVEASERSAPARVLTWRGDAVAGKRIKSPRDIRELALYDFMLKEEALQRRKAAWW
jgi:hypothetical protein